MTVKAGRDHSKALYWMMIVIIGGASLLGLPGLVKSLFTAVPIAGVVNGIPITMPEYRMTLMKEHRLLEAYREQFGSHYRQVLAMLGKSENLEETVREQLILSKLLLMVAQDLPLNLHDAYITRELSQPRVIYGVLGEAIPRSLFTEQGILRSDVIQLFLKRQGVTITDFEEIVARFLMAQWSVLLAHGATTVSESSLHIATAQRQRTKTYRIDTIDLASYRTDAEPISEEEIRTYYDDVSDTNKRYRYWSPERRSGFVYSIDLAKFSQDVGALQTTTTEPRSSEELFTHAAQQVLLAGDAKLFNSFIQEHRAKKISLTKVFLPDNASAKIDVTVERLFKIGRAGERILATEGSKGFIIELTDVLPRERLPLEAAEQKIRVDIVYDRARLKVEKIFAGDQSLLEKAQGFRSTTLTLTPDSKELPAESQAGLKGTLLTVGSFNGLLIPGQERRGSTRNVAYRIVLTELHAYTTPDAQKAQKPQESQESQEPSGLNAIETSLVERGLHSALYDEHGELLLRNLIASLRDRAILSTWTANSQTS